ncbi:MAG: hypothetical protein E7234_09825 [Lachnospiraceae bacterium]|nr:hypothetical protein [Lachnospiraceae bacterium]
MKNLTGNLQLSVLHSDYDKLQLLYGAKELNSIYGAGCIYEPDIMFIFMNPTGRNIASSKEWKGIRAPWIGTKNIWKLLFKVGLLTEETYFHIANLKPKEWDYEFAYKLYQKLSRKRVYITNLGKCTQIDAKPIAAQIYREYLPLLEKEIAMLKPKNIIAFGNQVSSILLGKSISVSKCRGRYFMKEIDEISYPVFPVYYPVGQGMRNISISIEDIKDIMPRVK